LNKLSSVSQWGLWGLLTALLVLLSSATQAQGMPAQGPSRPKLPLPQNIDLRQEIEINYRTQIIHSTQKAIDCMKNAKTIAAIDVCKKEESEELSVIKKYKKQDEALLLRK